MSEMIIPAVFFAVIFAAAAMALFAFVFSPRFIKRFVSKIRIALFMVRGILEAVGIGLTVNAITDLYKAPSLNSFRLFVYGIILITLGRNITKEA